MSGKKNVEVSQRYFSARDLAFVAVICAIITAVVIVSHRLAAPFLRIPGAIQVSSAFFVGIVAAIGLAKVKKVGTFTLIGVTRGLIAGFIIPAMPILFLAVATGGVFADGVTKLFRADYSEEKFVISACGCYTFARAVVAMGMAVVLGLPRAILSPHVILAVSLVCFALGSIGGYVGTRIAKELKEAGVMR